MIELIEEAKEEQGEGEEKEEEGASSPQTLQALRPVKHFPEQDEL